MILYTTAGFLMLAQQKKPTVYVSQAFPFKIKEENPPEVNIELVSIGIKRNRQQFNQFPEKSSQINVSLNSLNLRNIRKVGKHHEIGNLYTVGLTELILKSIKKSSTPTEYTANVTVDLTFLELNSSFNRGFSREEKSAVLVDLVDISLKRKESL